MNVEEAANYINDLKPKICVPIHYGKIVGKSIDEIDFKTRIDEKIEVQLLMDDFSIYSTEELMDRAYNLKRETVTKDSFHSETYLKTRYKKTISELAKRKRQNNGGMKK